MHCWVHLRYWRAQHCRVRISLTSACVPALRLSYRTPCCQAVAFVFLVCESFSDFFVFLRMLVVSGCQEGRLYNVLHFGSVSVFLVVWLRIMGIMPGKHCNIFFSHSISGLCTINCAPGQGSVYSYFSIVTDKMCSVFSSVLCKQPTLSSEGTGRTYFKVRNSLSSILWEEMVIPLFHEALCIADEILFVWSCVWYDLQQRHFGRHLLMFL